MLSMNGSVHIDLAGRRVHAKRPAPLRSTPPPVSTSATKRRSLLSPQLPRRCRLARLQELHEDDSDTADSDDEPLPDHSIPSPTHLARRSITKARRLCRSVDFSEAVPSRLVTRSLDLNPVEMATLIDGDLLDDSSPDLCSCEPSVSSSGRRIAGLSFRRSRSLSEYTQRMALRALPLKPSFVHDLNDRLNEVLHVGVGLHSRRGL